MKIKELITDWVKDNFDQSEVDDPSWNIDLLAEHIENNLKAPAEDDIYVICWTGRDCDSGVWDNYPCFDYGYFTSYDAAQEFADVLNKEQPQEYDDEADDVSSYVVQTITYQQKD